MDAAFYNTWLQSSDDWAKDRNVGHSGDEMLAEAGSSTATATTTAASPSQSFFLPPYYPFYNSGIPLSNYSTLNGATSQPRQQQPQPQAIDPALTNYQPQFYYQQPTLSPASLSLAPSAFYNPTPEQRKAQLLTTLNPLLDSTSFTGAQSVQTLVTTLANYGAPTDIEPQTRLLILSKMRDHAPNHYFRAWTENTGAMDIIREWLKAAVSAKTPGLDETIMPLLHIIDRLPLTVESLRIAKLGKLIVKLVKDPPSPAIKDMASKVERKWRRLLEGIAKPPEEDLASKKRKEAPSSSKPPPAKKPAPATTKTTTAIKKKEVVKDAKSDSSFFSAPKPKPKLPSFKKAPPAPKQDPNVAQPSSIDPFQDVLRSMGKLRKESTATPTPPPVTPSIPVANKKRKSVSWAPQDKLESIKLIERAIYDDDAGDGMHISLRDLDRSEGAALHAHLFEETVDWSEPLDVLIPHDINLLERGEGSEEKHTQEKREQTALGALYMSLAHVPDTPGEANWPLGNEAEVDKDVTMMVIGPDWSDLPMPPPPPLGANLNLASVSELIAQLGSTPDFKLESSAAMATLSALPPEQIHSLLEQVSAITQGTASVPAAAPQPPFNPDWNQLPNPSYDYSNGFHHSEDNWGAGRGRGRGAAGHRQFKRKPCSFYQAGRCKYGDQCDFAHEII